jgi:endoglucanase
VTRQRVPWRNDSALSDGQDAGLDLTGGYYDAGDYIKALYPFSGTVASIAWSAIDFGSGYERANQSNWLDKTLRTGLEWLIKVAPSFFGNISWEC